MENKERPIIFSTPMVKAILDDRKNQTRRLKGLKNVNKNPDDWSLVNIKQDERLKVTFAEFTDKLNIENILCRLNMINGDVLWVRESFCVAPDYRKMPPLYKADENKTHRNLKFKPSIHMPRKIARIFLEVTDIRVERLQDIQAVDCVREGLPTTDEQQFDSEYRAWLRSSFKVLWNSINGKDAWDINPWVWVISFERKEK